MGIPFIIEEIIFYAMPIILLMVVQKLIHKRIIVKEVVVKAPDLLVPFLLVGIHILSLMALKQSILPYFVIFVLAFGIVLVCLMAYKNGEILISRFFKMFWRFTFIFSFLAYYALVTINIIIHLN